MKLVYLNQRKAFIAMTSLAILIICGLYGIAYWLSSRMSTDMIFNESQRIKARNFAQAGVEKVKINIVDNYLQNQYDVFYSKSAIGVTSGDPGTFSKQYDMTFDDGSYEVVYIKPLEMENKTYWRVPRYQKGFMVGYYDIWDVKVKGVALPTKTTAEIRTFIRLYRDKVVYE